MDHAVKVVKKKKRSAFLRYLRRQRFSDAELEQIYQQYAHKNRCYSLFCCAVILALITLVQTILTFSYGVDVTLSGIYNAFQCCVLIFLMLILGYNPRNRRTFLFAKIVLFASLLVLTFFALPIKLPIDSLKRGDKAPPNSTLISSFTPSQSLQTAASNGIFDIVLYILLMYLLLPFDTYVSLAFGLCGSAAHILVASTSANYAKKYLLNQILANTCAFLWANGVGLFVQYMVEVQRRRTFLNMRNALSAKLDVKDEEERLENSLSSAFPKTIVEDMKREILMDAQRLPSSQYIECYDNVSILFADIVGFRSLAAQCNSADLVRILNELFTRVDELCTENHCMRVRILGDRYFAVCGVNEQREDHAICAVNFAIDLLDTITGVGEATELPLTVRCGIHSGHVTAGVVGIRKWQYDVWSTDVDIENKRRKRIQQEQSIPASQLEISAQPTRIHLSEATASLVSGTHQVEEATGSNAFLRDRGIKSYFLVTEGSLKKSDSSFPFATGSLGCRSKRMSFRNVSLSVLRLLNSAKFHSEVPFSSFVSADFKYASLGRKVKSSPSSDKFRRSGAGRRRSGTLSSPETSSKINRHLAQTLEQPGAEKEQTKHLNNFFLKFKDEEDEQMFHDEPDPFLTKSYLSCLLSLLTFGAFHAFVLPRELTPLILYVVACVWISGIFGILFVQRARGNAGGGVLRVFPINCFICAASLILFGGAGLANGFICPATLPSALMSQTCYSPSYLTISCVITQITALSFSHQPSALVSTFGAVAAVCYAYLLGEYRVRLLQEYGLEIGAKVPPEATVILAIVITTIMVIIMSRNMERITRLGFLWKIQATEDRCEVTELQRSNQKVLFNLLPVHVACHYLDTTFANNLDLYSNSYNPAGVLFASVPNFNEFYDAVRADDNCSGCFRLLHEMTAMFDELLFDDKFKCLDKIKTNGPAYVVAVGLVPELKIECGSPNFSNSVAVLSDFAFAMKERLNYFNAKYQSKFIVRIGIHTGPVISGVIGAKRPQYDIWGQTVNIACRLERASLPNHIQVSEDVYLATRAADFKFEFRGIIKIDEKSQIKTYLITDRILGEKPEKSPRNQVQNRGVALPGLAREPSRELRNPDQIVCPNDVIVEIEDEIEHKLPFLYTGKKEAVYTRILPKNPTQIQAIQEVTDVETDIEDLPLLASHLKSMHNEKFNILSNPKNFDSRKGSVPIIPTRLSRPEDLSLSCSFNEHLNRFREKSEDSFQKLRSTTREASQEESRQSGSSGKRSKTGSRSRTGSTDERTELVDAPGTQALTGIQHGIGTSPSADSFSGVKKRFRRKNKKNGNTPIPNWKRASTTSSEFEFVEPSPPTSGRTPDKWQIRSFFRARTMSSSSANEKTRKSNARQPLNILRCGESPFSPITPNSGGNRSDSASEFEMDPFERARMHNMTDPRMSHPSSAAPSPLDRSGYLAAVYGIPKSAEVRDPRFIQTNVPMSKPLGIVYPLPSPACSGYGSEKAQPSPRTYELLTKMMNDGAINMPNNSLSPLSKPFPVENPPLTLPHFIDSPDLAYTTGTNVSTSASASQGVTPASGCHGSAVRRAGSRKMISETEYDNAESEGPYSETDSFLAGQFSPESRMLRQPRLLVPGYNLSVIGQDSPSVPGPQFPDLPGFPAKMSRDDSYIDIMFGQGGSMRRRALGSLQSLDYLGIDTGNEADVDSLASSRCSSRLFSDPVSPGYCWQPASLENVFMRSQQMRHPFVVGEFGRRGQRLSGHLGYDSEYDNFRPGMHTDDEFRPEPVSDMEIDFFDHDSLLNLRRVTADIQKSFGNVQLSTYSDSEQ